MNRESGAENENELDKSDIEFPFHLFPGLRKELGRFEFQGYFDDEIFYHNEIISGECLYWGYRHWEPPSKQYMLREMDKLGAVKEIDESSYDKQYKYRIRRGNIWILTE